jgi:hypothetical protein
MHYLNQQMKKIYIKLILMVCIAISACTNDIPEQTRELLHGVWARTGYKEKIPVLYTPENIAASFEDTVLYYVIDPLYHSLSNDSVYRPNCPTYRTDTLNDTTFCLEISYEPWINKDSLTLAERNSTTSIWVIEECYVNNKSVSHPVCLTYQGKGLFYSEKNAIDGTMKYLRIKDKKDSTVEYGKCDSDGKILSNVELSQLFTGKSWYFDRGLFGWSDYSYRSDDQLESLFFNEAFKNVKCIELRQSLRDGDSLICVYDMKDVIKKNGIWINNSNSTVSVDTLYPHLKYAEEVDLRDPEAARSDYSLIWQGDSAFLKNRNLQGTFYLTVIS